MPAVRAPDPPLPTICTAVQARAAGLTPDQIRHRVRADHWQQLAKGVYFRGPEPADPREVHVHRALAAALLHPNAVIGFESGVVIHGLPLNRPIPDVVTMCVSPGQWSGTRAGVLLRQAALPEDLRAHTMHSPLTGTSIAILGPAVTWTQITSHGALADGLVIGDAGLRSGAFTRDELSDIRERLALRRGRAVVDLALRNLDARRESPLESQSWAYLVRNGLPLPEPQVDILDTTRGFLARVDLLWREHRVIGEVDGRSKYLTPQDVYREKRREDALRELGYTVIRWGSADLRSAALAHRIARVLVRASRQSA